METPNKGRLHFLGNESNKGLFHFCTYFLQIVIQKRDFSKVPYLLFFVLGLNKRLCPLLQSPLFEVSTVHKLDIKIEKLSPE